MATKTKDLDYYLRLDYPIELVRDSDQGGYFARHPDLLGCTAEGATPEEAVENLNESRELWLETRLESGYPIPEPTRDEYAGRISLRVSPTLHAFLARAALRHGMSLNQLLNVILSEWMGGVSVKDKVAEELRSLLSAAGPVTVTTAETRIETKTETNSHSMTVIRGGGGKTVPAVAMAGQ